MAVEFPYFEKDSAGRISDFSENIYPCICTHPSKHKGPVTGAKEVVDHHKLTCWEENVNREVGGEEMLEHMDE